MALARCVLGKFLGVVFHCFPLVACIKYEIQSHTMHLLACKQQRWYDGVKRIDKYNIVYHFVVLTQRLLYRI
jgi:hypothetical protein